MLSRNIEDFTRIYIIKLKCSSLNIKYLKDNPITYIGRTTICLKSRFGKHIAQSYQSNTKLAKAIRLFGIDQFEMVLLRVCKKKIEVAMEEHYITLFDSRNNGLNIR